MIKITRNNQSVKAKLAIKDLENAKVKDRGYNTTAVNAALFEIFHGKCYICEHKIVIGVNIEHLIPYKRNLELKYDFNNLFLSCVHCNNIKNTKYDNIFDCTKIDVDNKIAFRLEGSILTNKKYYAEALENDSQALETVALINEVYTGNTPQKRFEAKNIVNLLDKDYSNFRILLRDYKISTGSAKEDNYYLILQELGEASAFAGFKRWLIKDNAKDFPEFMEFLSTQIYVKN